MRTETITTFDHGDIVLAVGSLNTTIWVRWADNEWRNHSGNSAKCSDAIMAQLISETRERGSVNSRNRWIYAGNLFGHNECPLLMFQASNFIED